MCVKFPRPMLFPSKTRERELEGPQSVRRVPHERVMQPGGGRAQGTMLTLDECPPDGKNAPLSSINERARFRNSVSSVVFCCLSQLTTHAAPIDSHRGGTHARRSAV